jgi:parallel beta-helix repeat protein
MRSGFVGFFIATCIASLPSVAGDGATPIWEPTTIDQPGKYVLTRDVVGSGIVIDIEADHVDLNLNGFTIENTGVGSATVRIVGPRTDVSIHGGAIVGGSAGIWGGSGGSVTRLAVRRVSISTSGARGLYDGGNSLFQAVIEDNVIGNATVAGMSLDCEGCLITRNTVRNPSGSGIVVNGSGNTIRDNTVSDSGGIGLSIASGSYNQIESNVLTRNDSFGLNLTGSSCVYRGNTARGNSGTGCTNSDVCLGGTGNTSNGDNYMPNLM